MGRFYTSWSSYSRKTFPYKYTLTLWEPLTTRMHLFIIILLRRIKNHVNFLILPYFIAIDDRQIIIIAKIYSYIASYAI